MPKRESKWHAAQGSIGELRAQASSVITMRDLIGQRTISAKVKHIPEILPLFCYKNHRFHNKQNRIATSKVR